MTLVGDAIHSISPVGGLGGNAALRDANLLCATLTAVRDGQAPLVPALHRYEVELRGCSPCRATASRWPVPGPGSGPATPFPRSAAEPAIPGAGATAGVGTFLRQ
ncbi:MAG: FAD-dependent monooxygenase [Actinomycetota bacterium]|nr:FAD-dependent monooxygenase [Actinomycetota bacterium]